MHIRQQAVSKGERGILKEIKKLLNSPHYNRTEALEKHLCILEAQRERIDGLIALVKAEINGAKEISFSAFSNSKVMELQSQFQKEVLEKWGDTESFKEYEAIFSSKAQDCPSNKNKKPHPSLRQF